ncbi:MAG: 3-phosphoshikimate 1-carboxyvinyltransferase [Acidimicrobiia bacterium]|nr:3-phosphoshikimate 1-carboxyvinyltransferase [Acidimicrobiia bacterium]MYA38807.1 3-phosphoshikimate 1-carboxyvinyltransferase [Acidimicrobiia bacterium]MYG91558.1 3-phosphoshikimate 1-carboxyvinyltransferase [Acidimicrobiia bacterium]MYK56290.1 3-phosphoshikimate 1-carboxyvinyltransferase [Acidimicrobiia bacterium]
MAPTGRAGSRRALSGGGDRIVSEVMDSNFPPVMEIAARKRPVRAVVRPPGSKSITNRALVVAAMAGGGASRLEGPLEADDTEVMRTGLRSLGVLIDDADDPWLVLGTGGEFSTPEGVLDVGASGTTARFLTAVAVLCPGEVTIDGTGRMRERPIGDLASALGEAGVEVHTRGGYPPLTVGGGEFRGGQITVDVSRSSQFLSAVLMVAPMAREETVIRTRGDMVSGPYVQTTLEVMMAFGAAVEPEGGAFRVRPDGYRSSTFEVEADASAAVYPMAAAAITGGVVGIEGLYPGSTQADVGMVEVLAEMGCSVRWQGARLVVEGPPSGALRGVDRDMSGMPDAALGLSVMCLFADGPSRLRRLGTLRLKETDRLAALATEISRAGAEAVVDRDDLLIRPGSLRPARFRTYEDHRMAMSFALVGLRQEGVEISDPGCVTKTWPGYFTMLESL